MHLRKEARRMLHNTLALVLYQIVDTEELSEASKELSPRG